MKSKFYIILIFLMIFPVFVKAEKQEALFSKCVDGDTAKVVFKDETITLRFLAIDTPETKHPSKKEEPYGKEASEFTCSSLENASIIEIEYDENSDILDKYNRHLVWIFVDGELLQSSLIKKGYAKTAYLYGDYKYTSELIKLENISKAKKVGIWSDYEENYNYLYFYISLAIIILLIIFSKKYRKK